jgi:hypothetical protein
MSCFHQFIKFSIFSLSITIYLLCNPIVAFSQSALTWKSIATISTPNFSIETTNVGNKILTIQGPGTGYWSTTLPVKQGKKYNISLKLKTETIDNNPYARFSAYVLQEGGTAAKTVLYTVNYNLKEHPEWTTIHLGSYIPHYGVTRITIRIYLNELLTITDTSKIYCTDIQVTEDNISQVRQGKLVSKNTNYTLWTVDPYQSVYKNDPVPEGTTVSNNITLKAAAGEKESFQLVLNPGTDWNQVSWEWSDFSNFENTFQSIMHCNRVEYITIPEQDMALRKYLRGGFIPDPLPVEKVSQALNSENTPFIFTVSVPVNAQPGEYKSTLILKNADSIVTEIPITLVVRNFSLPEQSSFDMCSRLLPSYLEYFEKGDPDTILKQYLNNIYEHRATTFFVPSATLVTMDKVNHKVILNSTEISKWLSYYKKLGWERRLYLSLDIGSFIARTNILNVFSDKNNSQLDPEFIYYFSDYLNQLINLLIGQDCFYNPILKFADEPDISNPNCLNYFLNLASYIKSINSDIFLISAGDYSLNFLPYYDKWDFHITWSQYMENELAQAEEKNSKYLYATNMAFPSLPPLRMRLFFWALWKQKYKGLHWWQINGWIHSVTLNDGTKQIIKDDPWTKDFSQTYDRIVFIYPPREGKEEVGPINSIRWEAMRKGIEDYEYLNLLSNLIKEKEGKVSYDLILNGKKALNRVDELVYHLPFAQSFSALNDHFHTYDTALVEEVRDQIADAIESLLK